MDKPMPVPGDKVLYVTHGDRAMDFLEALVWNVDGDRLDLFVSMSDGPPILWAGGVPMSADQECAVHTWQSAHDQAFRSDWFTLKAAQRRADHIEDQRIIAEAQAQLSPELRGFELVLRRKGRIDG